MQTLSAPFSKSSEQPQGPGHLVTWRGYQIHYVRAGQPHPHYPPLLLVHGFGASTDHWKKNIAELQADFEVWAIDLLGFGRSAKPSIDYSGSLWRDQLRDFIAEQIGRPVVLAGNSLGGYACLSVAAEFPEWAAGVVLLNSAGPFTATAPEPEPNPFQKLVKALMGALMRQPWVVYPIFMNLRRPATVRKTLGKVYVNKAAITDELVADILRPAFDRGAFQVFASVFKAGGKGKKVDELLAQISCPLLLLWGEGDPWINVAERSAKFREFAAKAQSSQASLDLTEHFLPAGHCPHDELPDQVNRLIREWVLANKAVP
jgi:pimeloyl-ACP methyl ester carboxylesterase